MMWLSIILATLVAWMLVRPHLQAESSGDAAIENSAVLQNLLDQKERCVQVLKDLELDQAMHKLQATDYADTRGRLSAELAGLLKQIELVSGRKG